eukprot:SAG11_NODE_1348_length_5137_cov_3.785232_4_plen_222_part_00
MNQLPAWTEISGDVRLTPFYNIAECCAKVDGYVAEINARLAADDPEALPTRGPCSKYAMNKADGERFLGSLEFTWAGEPFKGIACRLDSPGYAALVAATEEIKGSAKPYSITGSLPLVGDLQEAGFDVQVYRNRSPHSRQAYYEPQPYPPEPSPTLQSVCALSACIDRSPCVGVLVRQVCGYGLSSVYHGDDEYCSLNDMKDAEKILGRVIDLCNVPAPSS